MMPQGLTSTLGALNLCLLVRSVYRYVLRPFSSQVVFDRDLLITHMVSPEGEQLKLVEPIDPKGQNVEAWMLELEGNMRLTVRVR